MRLPKEKPRSEVAFVMNRLFAMRRIDCRTSSPDREVNWQCSPRPGGTPGREARFRRAFSATTEHELASMTELRRQCRPAGMAGAVSVAGHPAFRGGNLLRSWVPGRVVDSELALLCGDDVDYRCDEVAFGVAQVR